MIEAIKNLPQPALIAICIGVYIIIAVIFTFVAGLITEDDDFEFLGMFWIVAIPIMVVFGVLWFLLSFLSLLIRNLGVTSKERMKM